MVIMLKHNQWNLLAISPLTYIDFKKMNPPPLKSQSRINSYFQMNYSHCCTMIQCLKYTLKVFVSLMIDQLIHSSVCRHPKGHVALDKKLSCDRSQDIFKGHLPIDSSTCTHYAAFYTVGQNFLTPTLTQGVKQGGVFTNCMMVLGMTRRTYDILHERRTS